MINKTFLTQQTKNLNQHEFRKKKKIPAGSNKTRRAVDNKGFKKSPKIENEKTIREWFKKLPVKIRRKAIKNTLRNWPDSLNSKKKSLKYALTNAFPWKKSPEGFEYWNKIMKNISNK